MSKQEIRILRVLSIVFVGLLGTASLTGCLVAGVSSNGGSFIWPGGLGLLVMVLIIIFVLRRR